MNKVKKITKAKLKKLERRELKKKDKDWAINVKIRDNNKCIICGYSGNEFGYLNAHHLINRQNKLSRHDINNGVTLCPKHHKFGNESFHKNPIWSILWLQKYRKMQLNELEKYMEIK